MEHCKIGRANLVIMLKSVPNADKGEGVKKSENFADVIYGCSRRLWIESIRVGEEGSGGGFAVNFYDDEERRDESVLSFSFTTCIIVLSVQGDYVGFNTG